jgi:hypothetical protein
MSFQLSIALSILLQAQNEMKVHLFQNYPVFVISCYWYKCGHFEKSHWRKRILPDYVQSLSKLKNAF